MNRFNSEVKEFLLKEFDTAWAHLRALDDRRYLIFTTFTIFTVAIIGGVFTLAKDGSIISDNAKLPNLIASVLLVFISFVCSKVINSEREATERYRNKINKIRSMFLSDNQNILVKDYVDIKNSLKYSVRLDVIPTTKLKYLDIFRKDKYCTALYIRFYIQTLGLAGFILTILSILRLFNLF